MSLSNFPTGVRGAEDRSAAVRYGGINHSLLLSFSWIRFDLFVVVVVDPLVSERSSGACVALLWR